MPKKRAPAYSLTKPSSQVHPSLERSATPSSSAPASPQTVNERIKQLRREQAPRVTAQRRDELTEVVTKPSVPPQLRRILQMAEVDSPRPKPGSRLRSRQVGGARPPPGPAAPTSWLQASRHASDHIRNVRRYRFGEGSGPGGFCALVRVHDEEFHRIPDARSLIHQCLKTFAIHWEELVEYEQHYLPALPVSLKEALLSYLSVYGAKGGLDMGSLKILFGNSEEVAGGSGSDEIRFLDLTGLLSERYTLSDLNRSLMRPTPPTAIANAFANLSLTSPKGKGKAPVEVAESWEDEFESGNAISSVPTSLSVPHFPNLTRLSLAHPGAQASWINLLALSRNLKTLTHLSLAYWPTPSTTPNAATASMVSKHTSVTLGGSHFYSELDDDWHEAANILRRLSQNTYCLKWLDLEGCTWHQALTWDHLDAFSTTTAQRADDTWNAHSSAPGPDWNGAWRQIEYINLYQGWIPGDQHALRTMPAGVVPVQLLSRLRDQEDHPNAEFRSKLRSGDVYRWVEREKVARNVEHEIHRARKDKEGKWCVVEHGWTPFLRVPEKGGEGNPIWGA